MTKRFISLLLAASMILALALCGCSSSSKETERKKRKSKKTEKTKVTETIDDDDDDDDDDKKSTKKDKGKKDKDDDKKGTDDDKKNDQDDGTPKIGISMPTKDLMRWNMDGDKLKDLLEAEGYRVDLQYADNDVSTQVFQVSSMIDTGCDVLVIAAVDGNSFSQVLDDAKSKNIPVIAYDRLIMNSDAVSYYATFDNYMVGIIQGEYIRETLALDDNAGPFNIEIFAGDPGDYNAAMFYQGAIDVLKPYIDSGKLVVPSAQIDFNDVATNGYKTSDAQNRMDAILSFSYSDGKQLDAVLCPNDSIALGVENSLAAFYVGNYPVITGQDCDIANVKNIISGKQSMSVFKDTRTLADMTVEMVDAIVKGLEVPVNDNSTYDNGVKIVPSNLVTPIYVDINNYRTILIDSGYYTDADLS
ncbi:MAG: sugar-binding protein [Clostridiales bacterium]|nr:sugar-binding protein [Clostridiales bacterium]